MSDFSAILERLRELEESGHGDAPISAMSRAELIDYLGTTDAEVANMSDDELRDAAEEKGMDMAEGEACNHTPEGKECPEHGLAECGSMMVTMGEDDEYGFQSWADEEEEGSEEEEDIREQRLAQRVIELTQRLQSFKEQLAEMDPAAQDPEEIRKQQTITTNLNQMKAAGVDIDPSKGTEDPAFNKEVGDKVAAAMADPALGQQLKGVLGKVKD
jgi:hypothetical protein